MNKLRTVIVDDEPPARELLRQMLDEHTDIEIVGECANGAEALALLRAQSPELILLDIQMPELDGFALLEALTGEHVPTVIFVTAYDRYAVRAFEVAAADYLLKPFDHDRLARALERARHNLHEQDATTRGAQMLTLLQQLHAQSQYLARFIIKQNGRVLLVPANDVDWIEAEGNYLRLHVGKASHLLRETLNHLETQLDPRQFLRIHRSTMVNLDRVQELQVHFNDELLVLLRDGRQLTLSRRYREKVSRALGASI